MNNVRKVEVKDVLKSANKQMNPTLIDTASGLSNAHYQFKIDDLLDLRGLTQRDLSHLTGLPLGSVSDWVSGKSNSINKTQLIALMYALRVDNVSDLFEVHIPQETKDEFKSDREEWLKTKKMPPNVKKLYTDNFSKKFLKD